MSEDQEQGFDLAELARRLANVVRLGTVEEADYAIARVRVKYDEGPAGAPVLTAWLPWITTRAGGDRSWWAPEAGEQVLLLAPSGELGQGVVLPAVYRTAHPANGERADLTRVDWGNGSWAEHDRKTGTVKVHAKGDVEIVAEGNIRLKAARIDLN